MPLLFLALLIPFKSFAFLDFLGEQAKKGAEAAAYADAVSELIEEVNPSSELSDGANDLNRRADYLRRETSSLKYVSRTSKEVLLGPQWTSKRLETNIRNTTEYARKLKRLIARIAILGTDGATALNTTETNVALNDVQKNQQVLIMQNEARDLREMEKEQELAKSWADFSDNQKKLRNGGGLGGKHDSTPTNLH